MGIIDRFKEIMAANFNAMLDKAEDPEKMIDQYLRNLEEDLAKVKSETASVMADEKNALRKVETCRADIDKMSEYARRAVTAGNDEEAKQFLKKKADLTDQLAVLEKDYQLACECSAKMRQMHNTVLKRMNQIDQFPKDVCAKQSEGLEMIDLDVLDNLD